MLSNRLFKVIISESKQKTLNNGQRQGSVLAPLLFNLYTYDIPPTDCGKYIYHFNNKMANHKININFNAQVIKNTRHPKYLGVTLDRTLTYKEHLTNTAA